MKEEKEIQQEITKKGNPGKPQGEEGVQMLQRMNESHYAVTGWALGFLTFQEDNQVLDIGCGGGATLKRMSGYIKTGHLTGVDYSKVSVSLTQELGTELWSPARAVCVLSRGSVLPSLITA